MSFPGCSEGGLTGTHWGFQEPPACARGGAQGQAEAVQHADAWKPGPREARTGLAWARAPGLPPAPAPGSRLAFFLLPEPHFLPMGNRGGGYPPAPLACWEGRKREFVQSAWGESTCSNLGAQLELALG